MSRENVDALRAVYEEWGKGNFREGGTLWDRRVLFVPAPDLPDVRDYFGPEGITEFMTDFLRQWESYTIEADELIEAGDSVVVTTRQRGVGRGSGLAGDTPNDFHVWTFRGPTVIRFEAFRDRAEALKAVGLSE